MASRPALSHPRTRAFGWAWLGVLLATIALSFALAPALPFQDLPAHAGILALRERLSLGSGESKWYIADPHLGPYSLFRGLSRLLSVALGPLGAMRAVGALATLSIPLSVAYGRKRLHADSSPALPLLAVSLSLGLMTLFGFASFLLAVSILLIAFVEWTRLVREPRIWPRGAVVAGLATLTFVAHGFAFLLLLFLVGIGFGLGLGQRGRSARALVFAPALLLATLAALRERGSGVPLGAAEIPYAPFVFRFQAVTEKLGLLGSPTLMTRTGVDLVLGVLAWGFLSYGAARAWRIAGSADSPSRRWIFAAAGLMVVFVFAPHAVGWFGFVDGRLLLLVLLLVATGLPAEGLPVHWGRWVSLFAPVSAGVSVALLVVGLVYFQREASGFQQVLARVPTGAHLLNLPADPNSRFFSAHPFTHYDKLILAERPVVLSDLWFHMGTGVYLRPEHPALRLPPEYSESQLETIDWSRYHLEDWDHLLVRSKPDSSAPNVPGAFRLKIHLGGWWLFTSARDSDAASRL